MKIIVSKNRQLQKARLYMKKYDDGLLPPGILNERSYNNEEYVYLHYKLLRIRKKLNEFLYYADRDVYKRVSPILLNTYYRLSGL